MEIGRVLNRFPRHNVTVSVIDREYVLNYWKSEGAFPIDYQLSLFCRRLFDDVWEFYPNFFEWVDRKFIPGLINGEREILLITNGSQILGYAALKNTYKEVKICTLYVKPSARKLGIGSMLLSISKDRLREDRPLITVGEDRVDLFSSMFVSNDFQLVGSINDLYESGKKEFVFNKELVIDESAVIDKTKIRR